MQQISPDVRTLMEQIEDASIEQAEYLDQRFDEFTYPFPDESRIIRHLTSTTAKLLEGPRGCGKTTLLIKAQKKLEQTKPEHIAIYVNFKNSIRLEPFYYAKANATFIFEQWICARIVREIVTKSTTQVVAEMSLPTEEMLSDYISILESGKDITLSDEFAGSSFLRILERITAHVRSRASNGRVYLFLDDIAHAFSQSQQVDFFDLFRKFKEIGCIPKAAVYPGVTEYGSNFHVGHDASRIQAWVRPLSNDQYLSFMMEIVKKRFPTPVADCLLKDRDLFEILCFSAYGIPRALIFMIRNLFDETNCSLDIQEKKVFRVVRLWVEQTQKVFESISIQAPRYTRFVKAGNEVLSALTVKAKEYNKSQEDDFQCLFVGLKEPFSSTFNKTLSLLNYAGLISYEDKILKGTQGTFAKIEIHLGQLIDKNALIPRKIRSPKIIALAINTRKTHAFPRISASEVFDNSQEELCALLLPPCKKCKTPRVSEAAKFCHTCGSSLSNASLYQEMIGADVSSLPIPASKLSAIINSSALRTVGDILLDEAHLALLNVPGIGQVWATRIHSYAQEFIS